VAAAEHDDDHEDVPFRAPLPKDDRLWRHPSELDEPPRRLWGPFRHRPSDSTARAN